MTIREYLRLAFRKRRSNDVFGWDPEVLHHAHLKPWAKKLVIIVCFTIALCYLCHPKRFPGKYDYIKKEDIHKNLLPPLASSAKPCVYTGKKVIISDILNYTKESNFSNDDSVMQRTWVMQDCSPHKVAIVVPYRDRSQQLDVFLHYMHWFLQTQLLDYHIYIVEQSEKKEFNRAFLFNVGYIEAQKASESECFIFHDVDLLPENLENIYACTTCPRHMSSAVNTMRYTLIYPTLFGGVVAISSRHFAMINGFPNRYFGWGGEDDDMSLRVVNKNLVICRFSPMISRYTMLPHPLSKPNEQRLDLLEKGREDQDADGLNSIANKYVILGMEKKLRHTVVHVEIL